MQANGSVDRMQAALAAKAEDRVRNPLPVAGIGAVREARSWTFDPSIVLERDIRDQKGRLTEIDPLWNDDVLTTVINPEVALFNNPIAVAACAGDCAAATAKLPIDEMFWCDGCNGSMFPMNGNVAAHNSPVQSSRLAAERLLFKMHRQGLAWGTAGSKALCNKYIMPILKKSQYRIQMTNPTPTVNGKYACSPIGASTLPPDAGRAYPVGGEDFGYLLWRKRNCCML